VFDGTLRQALAVQLEQSPYLRVVSDEQVHKALRLMGRSPGERLTNALAREVCQREGVKAMLGGSVASLGKTYVVNLEATNCATGDVVAREQREATGQDKVLPALGQATSALRGKAWRVPCVDQEVRRIHRGRHHVLARCVEGVQPGRGAARQGE
jgi:hypothetical protein